MKIKSLLLGSAAASMLAVSGAQAADPIIYAEPEPMEYVRICDVYGAGFFYIPGTETCLAISGFARYQIGAVNNNGGLLNYHGFTPGGWNGYYRGRVNFDARSETEWGTLRGYVRLEGTGGPAANAVAGAGMPWVFVSLGNERGEALAGFLESAWVWGGPTGNYGMLSDTGGAYGFQRRQQIRYTFSGAEGFFGLVSVELQRGNGVTYTPDFVGKAGVSQAWGGVHIAGAYDGWDRSWAGRVGANINVPNAPGSQLQGRLYYSNSATNAFTPALGGWANSGARWSAMIGYHHQFNPQFGAAVNYQYIRHYNGMVAPTGGAGTVLNNGRTNLADLSLIWTPVTNLEIRTEFGYAQARGTNLQGVRVRTNSAYSGFLRFQRSF